jgi:hypothetical protein
LATERWWTILRAVKYVAGAGLVITGALITGLAFLALRPGSPADRKPDALRVAAASLKDSYEITVTRANPAVPPGVGRLDALKTATRETRFLGGDLEDAHLVYFTDPHYGKQRGSAPIIPFYKHRLTWIVLFRHATQWVSGPAPEKEGAPMLATQSGVAAFVDAKTGALITAMTIDDLP